MSELVIDNSCVATVSQSDDVWGAVTGWLWYSLLVMPSISLISDFFMIGEQF
jgi:hypothetical protein